MPVLSAADVATFAALAVLAGVFSFHLGSKLEPLTQLDFANFWFGADSPRVFANLTDRLSNHYRTSVHPLFSLLVASPILLATHGLQVPEFRAVLAALSVNAALVTGILYIVLRLFLPLLDAVLYSVLFLSSAAFIFWFGTPETFAWGGMSLLVALLIGAAAPFGRGWCTMVLASALTLSFTVTNWMGGLAAALVSQPLRRAVQASVYAFALVAVLTPVQYMVFPSAGKFLYAREEQHYLKRDLLEKGATNAANFWVGSLLASRPTLYPPYKDAQHGSLGSTNGDLAAVGRIAGIAWLALLGMGLWASVRDARFRSLKIALALMLAGQAALHLVYVDEPFLYAAHYLPLLIVLAALSSTTSLRLGALGLCVVALGAGAVNNLSQFNDSVELLHRLNGFPCAGTAQASAACARVGPDPSVHEAKPLEVQPRQGKP
jgi:hypothetical protein